MKTERRHRMDLMNPAELAILNAMAEVEKIGADERLTEAVNLLQKAKELVGDFEDCKEIGRLVKSKDHDQPFYWDGLSFVSIDGSLRLDSIRSDGDYFIKPVYVNQIIHKE